MCVAPKRSYTLIWCMPNNDDDDDDTINNALTFQVYSDYLLICMLQASTIHLLSVDVHVCMYVCMSTSLTLIISET